MTKEVLERALTEGRVEDCVNLLRTAKGDSIFVESGCLHAIGSGNLILEIQQNSGTTYRLYDWDRMGLDGTPRKLHISESIQSIQFDMPEPEPVKESPGEQILVDCKEFRIRKFDLAPGDDVLSFPSNEQPRLIHVISGRLCNKAYKQILQSGVNYLQPYVTELSLVAETEAKMLITDQFMI